MVTLAKGNRSKAVAEACKKYGGAYLGSMGGPAAVLGQNCIKKVEIVEYPELGMEVLRGTLLFPCLWIAHLSLFCLPGC